MTSKKTQNTVPSVDRAMDVIEFFSLREKDMVLSEFMDNIAIPLRSLIRILNTLCIRGFLDKSSKRGLYRIGLKFLYLGQMSLYSRVGSVFPYLHAVSVGKVYLSLMSEDKRRRMLEKIGLPAVTKNPSPIWRCWMRQKRFLRRWGFQGKSPDLIPQCLPCLNHLSS